MSRTLGLSKESAPNYRYALEVETAVGCEPWAVFSVFVAFFVAKLFSGFAPISNSAQSRAICSAQRLYFKSASTEFDLARRHAEDTQLRMTRRGTGHRRGLPTIRICANPFAIGWLFRYKKPETIFR